MIKNFILNENYKNYIQITSRFLLLIFFTIILFGCNSDDVPDSPYYMLQPATNGDNGQYNNQYPQQYNNSGNGNNNNNYSGQNPYANSNGQAPRRDGYYYAPSPQQNGQQPYNQYQTPASRYYSNPYANPPQNYYPYYDGDQYYAPPASYGSTDYYRPSNKASKSDISTFKQ